MPKGQCHCGAVRYEMPAEAIHQALCHCTDCRRHSGAPAVAWGLVPEDQLKVVQLAYFGGLSHSEIADVLGMPLGTVKGRMRLAMEKMRATLAEGM